MAGALAMEYFDKYWEFIIAILAAILGVGLTIKLKFKKKDCYNKNTGIQQNIENKSSPGATSLSINQSSNVTVNVNTNGSGAEEQKKNSPFFEEKKIIFHKFTIEEIQKRVNILIIDDDNDSLFDLKNILQKNWHVKSIDDLHDYNSKNLKNAHIVCIDIHGVGKKMGHSNGVKLLQGIAEKYPNKKLILYSAVSSFDNIFEKALEFADKSVSKNNIPEFMATVESLAKDLFSVEKCISSLYSNFSRLKIISEDISLTFFSNAIYSAIDADMLVDKKKIMDSLHISCEKSALIAQTIQELLKEQI